MWVLTEPWKVQAGRCLFIQLVRPAPPIGMPAPGGSATRRIVPGRAAIDESRSSSGSRSKNSATLVPNGSALMRMDVPAGANKVTVSSRWPWPGQW